MEKVLVTGATGFIGLHCIKQLLDRGYSVNGTLRSQDRQTEVVDSLERNNTPTRHLSLFEVDLNRDSGWDLAISCLLYTSPSPRDQRGSRMPSSA